MKKRTVLSVLAVCLLAFAIQAQASTINFYYTTLGSPDVFSNTYNTSTNTAGSPVAIGASLQGADGIGAGPVVGGQRTVYFTGETDQTIFQIPVTPGATVSTGNAGITAYLLAENPAATSLFTFNNIGNISAVPLTGAGLIAGAGTVHTVTGADINVSEMVWSPVSGGPVFYVTGAPGTGGGDLGTINLSTYVTTKLFTGITTAEDAHYDPFTGLILLFGQGQIDNFDPVAQTLGTALSVPGGTCGANTLTTGAIDGLGHALITNCGTLSYIDYSATHNILTGTVTTLPGIFPGKDIVIFQSTGTPEPSTMGFALAGLALVAVGRFRRG